MSKMPAIGKELYEEYPLMSAQTHEALVKKYARYAVDIALSNVPRGAIEAADAARAQGAEVEPIAYTNRAILEFNVNGSFIIDAMIFPKGKLRPEQEVALYINPPAPQPTDREKVLEEALRPFARLAKMYDPDEGDDEDKCWLHECTPTLGDLRSARAALAGGDA